MLSGLKTGIRHLAESLFSDSNRESKSKLCTLRRTRREFSRTRCAALPLRNRRKRRGVFLDAKRIGEQKGRTLFPIGSPFKGFCALSERNCRFGYFAVGVFMSIHRDERKQPPSIATVWQRIYERFDEKYGLLALISVD